METAAHKRFAVAVVGGVDDALHAIQQLRRNGIPPRLTSIIGEETSFKRGREISDDSDKLLELQCGSNAIVALAYGSDLPKAISRNIAAFEGLLARWLIPAHARRLTQAVAAGELLLLVELASMEDERVATRTLLRSCRGSVQVHDLDAGDDNKELPACAQKIL
ncbi:MAG: hypothetical protein ACOZAM_31705 [Pseudomonadota bacterium]|jgi:hypothetical protein